MSEQPAEVAINDPEDYSTSTRLKQIYQARRELRSMRQEAAAHRHNHPDNALSYYRTAIESYLMELDTLFERNEEGRRLWNQEHFGTVTITPPELPEQSGSYHSINKRSQPSPVQLEIRGLKTLFETESPISYTFEIKKDHELMGQKTERVTRSTYIDWTILNRMVSSTNSFMSDLGLGLDIDETDEWKI